MSAVKKKPVVSKVWNDNKYPHTEKFKGQMITIMPNSYIEMTPDDAEQFKGQFTPIKMFKGAHDPRFFKMIRCEHPENWGNEEEFTCPVTGKKYQSAEELNESLKRFSHLRHNNDDEIKNREIVDLKAQLAELAAQVQALTASMAPRGRGRPRKSGSDFELDAESTEGQDDGESHS